MFIQRRWGAARELEHHRTQVQVDDRELMVLFDFNIWIRRNTANISSGRILVNNLLKYMQRWQNCHTLVVVCDQAESTPVVKSFEQAHRDYRITKRAKRYELPAGQTLGDIFNEYTAPTEIVINKQGRPTHRGAIDNLINNRDLRNDVFGWVLRRTWELCSPDPGCQIIFGMPRPHESPLVCRCDDHGLVVRETMDPMNTGEGDVGLLAWAKHPALRDHVRTVYIVSLDGDMIPIILASMCEREEFDETGFRRQFFLESTYPGSWWDREKEQKDRRSGQVPVVIDMNQLYTGLDQEWRVQYGVHRPMHVFAFLTCLVGNDYVQELKGVPAEYVYNVVHNMFHRLNALEEAGKRVPRNMDGRRLIKRKYIKDADVYIYAADKRVFVQILQECVTRWDEFPAHERVLDAWSWKTVKKLEKFIEGPDSQIHSVYMRSLWCVNYMASAVHTMTNVMDPIGFGWSYDHDNNLYIDGYAE